MRRLDEFADQIKNRNVDTPDGLATSQPPRIRADRGHYEFEDDLLTIRHDGGRGCEHLEGNPTGVYRLTFTNADAVTFEVVTDECSAREAVLDGAQVARIPAG